MDPWVSFGLSCLALAGSGVALWFTWKFQARADLVEHWNEKAVSRFVDDRIPVVDLTITNIGNATARDVRVTIDLASRDDREYWDGWLDIDPAKQVTVAVPLLRVERQPNGGFRRQDVDHNGAWVSTILQPTVTLTWRKDWGKGQRRKRIKIVGEGY